MYSVEVIVARVSRNISENTGPMNSVSIVEAMAAATLSGGLADQPGGLVNRELIWEIPSCSHSSQPFHRINSENPAILVFGKAKRRWQAFDESR